MPSELGLYDGGGESLRSVPEEPEPRIMSVARKDTVYTAESRVSKGKMGFAHENNVLRVTITWNGRKITSDGRMTYCKYVRSVLYDEQERGTYGNHLAGLDNGL